MKDNNSPKNEPSLKDLTNEQVEKLLSRILNEMRRRDSERVTGDVLASSKALRALRSSGKLI
jgi:hypothetical protein